MASTTGDVRGGYDATAGAMAMPQNGWVLFSGVMLLFAGIWIAFEGLFAFFRSTWFIGSAVFGSLWIWALAWLVFGVLMLSAGSAIMAGQTWARWFGIVVTGLALLLHMLSFATYPWWSAVMIAVDVLVLFGLTARWNRSEGAPVA
ncbi:MAG: hypothetical protein E6J41_13070 [Chloroflexi bacterium]|nr:MAG: hypothetical protein E6J41_13070 [Chloroflexota bacterium]